MDSRTVRTDHARATFLSTLSDTCNVSEAARKAGIGRRTVYEWRDDDAEFEAAWDDAVQQAIDKLEGVAFERASTGESDRMLELLLKAHRGEKYREQRSVELTGKDGGPIKSEQNVVQVTGEMTAEQASEAYTKMLG
jgi:AcrR family transcriptional regulator